MPLLLPRDDDDYIVPPLVPRGADNYLIRPFAPLESGDCLFHNFPLRESSVSRVADIVDLDYRVKPVNGANRQGSISR